MIGENRKMLVFKLDELPELGRGSGVQLQRYRDGGLSDAMAFALADGISWPLGGESGRVRAETDLTPWRAIRGASGRIAPNGFPRSNTFEPVPLLVMPPAWLRAPLAPFNSLYHNRCSKSKPIPKRG